MQEKLTTARPYAEAVFDLAKEDGAVDRWSRALSVLAMIVSNSDMAPIVRDPRIAPERLASLIFDIAGEAFDKQAGNFVRLLIRAERLVYATEIAELFERLRSQAQGVVHVDVISAYELSPEQQELIAQAVGRSMGKEVEISTREDEALIGGAVIKAGDHVIDLSVRGRLRRLSTDLA